MPDTKIDLLSVLADSNLLDNIPCAVFLKDTESRFIGCNKFLANLVGFDNGKEMIGKTDDEIPWADELIHYHSIDQSVVQQEKNNRNNRKHSITNQKNHSKNNQSSFILSRKKYWHYWLLF